MAPYDPFTGKPNGITRLRNSEDNTRSMGPYKMSNVATACPTCNMMKGVHTIDEIVDICRTIATNRGRGYFGFFPERFRDNVSKKSRSSYLGDRAAKSGGVATSKTHSLSNAEFNRLVSMPCHYCGKKHDPPRHHNGLDRLDNSLRVYTSENAVSCCSTCNMAKGKFSEEFFLDKCLSVASQWVSPGCAAAAPEPNVASTQTAVDTDVAAESQPAVADTSSATTIPLGGELNQVDPAKGQEEGAGGAPQPDDSKAANAIEA